MGVSRTLFAALFLFLTVSVVNAYTVVMRDGRRVEIPNEFTVTNSTLTYDVGKGIQVTLQLTTIDVAATERVNGEAQGALLQRVATMQEPVDNAPQTRRSTATRTITNANLEKYRRERVASEREYEDRRKELGLPSMEERRQEVAAIEDRTLQQVRSMREREEALWRSRAEAFRAEAAANEAQFGSLRRSTDNVQQFDSFGGFPGFFPFDGFGFGVTGGRFNRFGRFQPSPFDGFLATPITPFPRFQSNPRPLIFTPRGVRNNPRPHGGRPGSRR
ncbi:MAG TPA: hypothetical protein VFI24_27815 [Pyrinomonadaceae bacterium]|nr:hypothetical protein [Pyrinomonadaceae bacterium]